MRRLIALSGVIGLIAVGCAERNDRGGAWDTVGSTGTGSASGNNPVADPDRTGTGMTGDNQPGGVEHPGTSGLGTGAEPSTGSNSSGGSTIDTLDNEPSSNIDTNSSSGDTGTSNP